MYPSVYYAYRRPTDTLGVLREEHVLVEGTGPFNEPGNGRWGNYAELIIYPSDDGLFYYAGQYGTQPIPYWSTRLVAFRVPTIEQIPESRDGGDGDEDVTAIAGGVVGGIGGILLLCCLCFCCIIIVVVLLLLLIGASSGGFAVARHGNISSDVRHSSAGAPLTYMAHLGEWEIPYEEISFGKKLGSGAYGDVFKGTWRKGDVAIKRLHTLKEDEQEAFLEEASIMKNLRPHKNVLQMYGICRNPVCIVTEFLRKGDLLHYLRKHSVSNEEKIRIAQNIAAGMSHLSAENIIHRDLAARNLLMGEDLSVKVADFGMSRRIDDDETSGTTNSVVGPIKWMSPECLNDRVYSEKTDVWAYGVTIWEVVTNGEQPYKGITAVKVAMGVVSGELKLEPPSDTPSILVRIIHSCLAYNHDARPTFTEICDMFDDTDPSTDVSLDENTGHSAYAYGTGAPVGASEYTSAVEYSF